MMGILVAFCNLLSVFLGHHLTSQGLDFDVLGLVHGLVQHITEKLIIKMELGLESHTMWPTHFWEVIVDGL